MPTLESIQAKIAKLQAQAEAIIKKDVSAVVAKIRSIMEAHGLTIADIDAHAGSDKKRGRKLGVKAPTKSSAPVAKFRDPKTGSTWTGHGRAPAWIAGAKDRDRFLIKGSAAVSTAGSKPPAKAGNYVRGVQPALYADPRTGATWSGRGRAPAWIAGARDKSKFLIERAAVTGSDSKATDPKNKDTKASVRKAATKKATVKRASAKVAAPAVTPPVEQTVAARKAPAKKPPVASKEAIKRATTAPKKTSSAPSKKVAAKTVEETTFKAPTLEKGVTRRIAAVKEPDSTAVVAAGAGDGAAPEVTAATSA